MHRVQRKRTKGYKLPDNTKCVNRGTRWGNPYKVVSIGKAWTVQDSSTKQLIEPVKDKDDAARAAVLLYTDHVEKQLAAGLLNLAELKGKNLACFCPLSSPCHADYLLKLIKH